MRRAAGRAAVGEGREGAPLQHSRGRRVQPGAVPSLDEVELFRVASGCCCRVVEDLPERPSDGTGLPRDGSPVVVTARAVAQA